MTSIDGFFYDSLTHSIGGGEDFGMDWDTEGDYSILFGHGSSNTGDSSTVIGYKSVSSSNNSISLGYKNTANGLYSVSLGRDNNAAADYSVSVGGNNVTNGIASNAFGLDNISNGIDANAIGHGIISDVFGMTVIGRYNQAITGSTTNWIADEPAYVVGIGEDGADRENGLVILKNGDVGIGTNHPKYNLHLVGDDTLGTLLISPQGTNNNDDSELIFSENETAQHGMVMRYRGSENSLAFHPRLNNSTDYTDYILFLDRDESRVGLGLNNPAYDLHLNNNSAAKPISSSWTVSSDRRLKKDIHDFEDGLKVLCSIKPVWYTYNGLADIPELTGVGVIAQELQEVAPYMVNEWTHTDRATDAISTYLGVDNGAMTYILINAVKEQQEMIDEMKKEKEEYREKLENLEARLDQLSALILTRDQN